jgi:single-stranded DNA-binding protein
MASPPPNRNPKPGHTSMTTRGIEAALWGTAFRDAEMKTSKAGNDFCVVTLMVPDGTDADGKPATTFVRVLAFGPHVAVAGTIKKGDRAYTEGALSASIWTPPAAPPRVDLTLRAFTLYKTGIGKNRPPREQADKPKAAEKPSPRGDWQAPPDGAGFDDRRGDAIEF